MRVININKIKRQVKSEKLIITPAIETTLTYLKQGNAAFDRVYKEEIIRGKEGRDYIVVSNYNLEEMYGYRNKKRVKVITAILVYRREFDTTTDVDYEEYELIYNPITTVLKRDDYIKNEFDKLSLSNLCKYMENLGGDYREITECLRNIVFKFLEKYKDYIEVDGCVIMTKDKETLIVDSEIAKKLKEVKK